MFKLKEPREPRLFFYFLTTTAIVYLMNKDGRFVAPFNMKRRPEEAAADLKRYL
jgi:protein SCO1/2